MQGTHTLYQASKNEERSKRNIGQNTDNMSRGQHKNKSHTAKRQAYNERIKKPGYPKGGYGKARGPYKNI